MELNKAVASTLTQEALHILRLSAGHSEIHVRVLSGWAIPVKGVRHWVARRALPPTRFLVQFQRVDRFETPWTTSPHTTAAALHG
jgi:hypothetical protein